MTTTMTVAGITTAMLTGMVPPGAGLLRVQGGEPLCCVYFFSHWWEPWRSDDSAMAADLNRLREGGINTLLMDHEWSQAIDGDWRWLDRGHRLARQAGMGIVPWLPLKSWSDIAASPERIALIKERYGVDLVLGEDQDGTSSSPLIYDENTIRAGVAYTLEYLHRYMKDGAITRVLWNGEPRPVVALTVELAWAGGSFDPRTNQRFQAWLSARYGSIIDLNRAWNTRYARYHDIDPRDKLVFDYEGHVRGKATYPQAVEDHVEFRAQMVDEGLSEMRRRVLARHPEVLIATELPYQIASQPPHAENYRITYAANPSTARHADILFLRMTGLLSTEEAQALKDHVARTGQRIVLCYRTYRDWGLASTDDTADETAAVYAREAARHAHGIGFYSWNEMVDVHVAAPGPGSPANDMTVEAPVADRMQRQLFSIVQRYRAEVGG